MNREPCERAGLTRRGFIGLAPAALWLSIRSAQAEAPVGAPAARDAGPLSPFEREHAPELRVPARTRNGAKVPILIEMAHPMVPDHYIKSVHVSNEADPIASKGTFYFTPANGRVYLAFQARMHDGVSEVSATAECNRHGKWTSRSRIEIPEGAGGCSGMAPSALARTRGDDIRSPVIRIPELVERGRIRRGEIIHPQVKMRHPNRSGLVFREGRFVAGSEPVHLDEMEVLYGGDRVGWFAMSSALADDPIITFALVAGREATLTVILRNNRGSRFESTHEIRFS
jgi:sulfur-oxidizing protein SoxY